MITNANGTKGFLINVLGKIMFRVYDENHNFKDYNIFHHDLEVTITDRDAAFYEDGQKLYLDYAPITKE